MQLVDLKKYQKSIHSVYMGVPQPMPIYHSEEELDTSEENLVKLHDYYELFKYASMRVDSEGVFEATENIFLKTVDKFVPDVFDTKKIQVILKLDENGNPIPTDSCWVRLYYGHKFGTKITIYTSSGVWRVGESGWNVWAAIGGYKVAPFRPKEKGGHLKDYTLRKLLKKRYSTKLLVRAIHLMLNPLSPLFMDPERALRTVYSRSLNQKHIEILQKSDLFRRTVLMEIKYIIPELAKAIKDKIPPEKIAEVLDTILTKAVDNESSANAMERVKDIVNMGYTDAVAGAKAREVPLIDDAAFKDLPNTQPAHKLTEQDKKRINENKTMQNYPDGYVMDDLPAGIEDILDSNE